MAKLPAYRLRNKRTGEVRIVNCFDYERNMSKWMTGWTRIGEINQQADRAEVRQAIAEDDGERFRKSKPGHIATKDPARRQAEQAITVSPETRKNLAAQAGTAVTP